MKTKKILFAMIIMISVLFCFNVSAATPSLKLSKSSLSLYPKQSQKLAVTVKDASASVKWTSSNKAVATVSSAGVVRGVKAGKVTITASMKAASKTYKATCTVTVKKPTIKLNASSASVGVGSTKTLKASVAGYSKTVTWSSSNKSVATVSSKGVVKGIKKGTCTITAKANGVTATCKITVTEKVTKAVLEAYAKKMREFGSNCSFALVYLDNNVIPELLITSSSSFHAAASQLFTYTGGKVIEIQGVSSDYGRFIFVPKKSIALNAHAINRYGAILNYVKVDSKYKTTTLIAFSEVWDSPSGSCYIDDKKVSSTSYQAKIKEYEGKYSAKILWPEDVFRINETNISNMISNYKTFIKTGKDFK